MMKNAIRVLWIGLAWVGLYAISVQADTDPTVWTNLGLYGGHVNTIAIDPFDSDRIFSGIYFGEGLFRSTDGAAMWHSLKMEHLAEGEDTFENQSVMAVAIAPSNPNVIWVAHNQWVAKSTDGGNTWKHILNKTMQKNCVNCSGREDQFRLCQAITIDPSNSDVVYVGTAGPLGTFTKGAIYRTTDGGSTWEKLNGGEDLDYAVVSVALHVQKVGVLWAVTSSNGTGGEWDGTVYISTDDGGSFRSPDPKSISGSGLSGLTWHPADPNVVFITGGIGVVRTVIDGTKWLSAYAVDGSALASPVVFAPADINVAYVGWNRPTGWGGDGLPKLSRSTDSGVTWETITLDPAMASTPNCLAVDPNYADMLYWGDASGGVLKSEDGGQTWTPVNVGLKGIIVHDVDSDPRDSLHLIAGTTGGVYERMDNHWLKRLNRTAHSIRFDPIDSYTYYAGLGSMLGKTRDGGLTWEFSSDGANGWISYIEIDATDTDTLFITDESHVRRSVDGGYTFTPVLEGINSAGEAHRMNVVVIDPSDTRRILAGGGNYHLPPVEGGLWESLDGGDTWKSTGLTDFIVNDVLIHPLDPEVLYAGCGHSSNNEKPVFISTDGGATWTASTNGFPPELILLYSGWVSPEDIFFAVGFGDQVLRVSNRNIEVQDTGIGEYLNAVYGFDANTVYAVGDTGTILHFDGQDWSVMVSSTTTSLKGIWGTSPDRLFAVGAEGQILQYDGKNWSAMASPTNVTLNYIFGLAEDNIFAAGEAGTIIHYDGSKWTAMSNPSTEDLNGVWGSPDNHWFAVGKKGTILTYDGDSWSTMVSGTADSIRGIWGSEKDVYAVTGYSVNEGQVLHFDGHAWTISATLSDKGLSGICGLDDQHIYAVQGQGGIYRYDGTQWETLREPGSRFSSVTDLEFHRQNPDIVYAATSGAGVYLSPNQGGQWLNLGTPQLHVNAISVGSLYAATDGGLYQLTGTGVLAGSVYNDRSLAMIDGARVTTDLGQGCRSIDGNYMMVAPAGIFDVYATADQHDLGMAEDVTVVGADVTWQDFEMLAGSPVSGASGAALTIDNDSSSGGAYCFIAAGGPISSDGSTWWLFLLAGGLFLLGWSKSRRWQIWVLFVGSIGTLWIVPSVDAFTLFQQVGVTSPPLPVGSGARAMGMGGAFIGIADDATAASWNPAGLVQLERPEISIVGDYYWRTESYSSKQHPEVENTRHNDHGDLNYFSAAFPFHWHKNMVVSVNYQRLYDFYRELNYRRNLSEDDLQLEQQIQYDQSGSVGALGLAGAVELTPRLSFGLTINLWTDQLGYDNGWEANYSEIATGFQAGVPVKVSTAIQDRYEQFRGVNFNLGLLWDMERWGGLGVIAKTPFTGTIQHHFYFEQTQTFGAPVNSASTNGPIRVDEEVDLHLPWSYGLGWSKRFGDRLTVGADLYRTEWSDYYLEDGQGEEFSPIDGRPRSASDVDATTHVRVGGEYLLQWPQRKLAVPIRAGLFYDPEPSEGQPADVYGIALGSGVSMTRCSIDLAYQLRWADDIDTGNTIATSTADITQHTLLASLIYYF